jgi:hypothetical protein
MSQGCRRQRCGGKPPERDGFRIHGGFAYTSAPYPRKFPYYRASPQFHHLAVGQCKRYNGVQNLFQRICGGTLCAQADNLSTTITELAANRDYYFKVAAKNTTGESRESETLLAATTPRITQIAYSETYRSSYYYPSVAVDRDGKAGQVHINYVEGPPAPASEAKEE